MSFSVATVGVLSSVAFIVPRERRIIDMKRFAGGTMGRVASITLVGNLALGVVALLCGALGQVRPASALSSA
jgi:hypothetical protein